MKERTYGRKELKLLINKSIWKFTVYCAQNLETAEPYWIVFKVCFLNRLDSALVYDHLRQFVDMFYNF